MSLITRVPGDLWVRMMSKSVSSITSPYRRKQALVWRQMPPKSHCPSMYRHSYPSRDEVRRVHVNVLLQFSRGHFIVAVFLAPLYPLVVIRQNFAQFKKIMKDID